MAARKTTTKLTGYLICQTGCLNEPKTVNVSSLAILLDEVNEYQQYTGLDYDEIDVYELGVPKKLKLSLV